MVGVKVLSFCGLCFSGCDGWCKLLGWLCCIVFGCWCVFVFIFLLSVLRICYEILLYCFVDVVCCGYVYWLC